MKFEINNSTEYYKFGSLNVIGLIGTGFFAFENGQIKKSPVLINRPSQKPLGFNPLEYSNNIMQQAMFNAYYKKSLKKEPIKEDRSFKVILKPIKL